MTTHIPCVFSDAVQLSSKFICTLITDQHYLINTQKVIDIFVERYFLVVGCDQQQLILLLYI